MSTPTSALLQLPTEIIEKIIKGHWALNLSTSERISFMCTSMLVNSTWMALYISISSADVYIPSEGYAHKIIDILQCGSDARIEYRLLCDELGLGNIHDLLQNHCRSITFLKDHESGPIDRSVHALISFLSEGTTQENAIRNIHLPSLRLISFHLVDETLDKVFPPKFNSSFKENPTYTSTLPSQVTTLEVFFSYSPTHIIWQSPETRKQVLLDVEDLSGLPNLPSIRTLRIAGCSAGAFYDLIRACHKNLRVCDSDVDLLEMSNRFEQGSKMMLERHQKKRERQEKEWDERRKRSLEKTENQMRYLIFEATDEEVMEALGLGGRDLDLMEQKELKALLDETKGLLGKVLSRERQGRVDLLAKMLLKRTIKVCEKVIRGRFRKVEIDENLQPDSVTDWESDDDEDGYITADENLICG